MIYIFEVFINYINFNYNIIYLLKNIYFRIIVCIKMTRPNIFKLFSKLFQVIFTTS